MVYELFEHTADLGLRIEASSLDTLFEEAARALFSVIVENFEEIRPAEEFTYHVSTSELDDLLHDWLAELLYVFHADHLLLADFAVRIDQDSGRLSATARGEHFDPQRHELDAEIKAITYHGLVLDKADDDWRAEVIVDI